MTAEQNKELVRRLVEEAVNPGNLDVLDEIATGEFAVAARRWAGPFRDSFPDFTMEIAGLAANGEKVAAHFRCSGTHLGAWMGHPPTGRRFQDVDEIYIFRVRGGKLGPGGTPDRPLSVYRVAVGFEPPGLAPVAGNPGLQSLLGQLDLHGAI
jgi:predicted ester cyclase